MSGRLYLGNQIVSPAIIIDDGGGIDASKYDVLPYLTFSGRDYVDLGNQSEALNSQYSLIPYYKIDTKGCYFGDKVWFTDSVYTYNGNSINTEDYNGEEIITWAHCNSSIRTNEELTFENDLELYYEGASIASKRLVLANAKRGGEFAAAEYPVEIEAEFLNLDEFAWYEDSNSPIIFKNTYLEVTSNTNGKVFDFYQIKGNLGFFVKNENLQECSFSFRTVEDFSEMNFSNNGLYNVTITDREDEDYYYKDVTITPKNKSGIVSSGYTEDEADVLLQLMSIPYTEPIKLYETRKSDCTRYESPEIYINLPSYILAESNGTQKFDVFVYAQKNNIVYAKGLLSGKFGYGLNGYVSNIGKRYPVTRKSDNVKGFIDISNNEFYPFIQVPYTITFNTNYEGCLYSYEIDGTPIDNNTNTVSVYHGSTLTYSITKPQEGNIKYSVETGSIKPYNDETININVNRTYRITIATNYEGCNYYFDNIESETNYSDIFAGTEVTCKVSKLSDGDIDYSTETKKITVTQDETVTINIKRTYLITIEGSGSSGYIWEKDDGLVQSTEGEWRVSNPFKEWDNITYEYIRFGQLPDNDTYYEYKELATNLLNDRDRTLSVGELKSFTATGDYSRPNLTENGTLWSDTLAVDGAAYSATYPAWKAFDGNTSTYWRTASNEETLTITSQKPLMLSSMTFTFNSTSTVPSFIYVYGLVKNQDNTVSSLFLKKQGQTYGSAVMTLDLQYKPHGFYGYAVTFKKSSGTCYLKEVSMVGKELQENT